MLRTTTLATVIATLLVPAAISRAEQPPTAATPENSDSWAKLCDPGMKWEFEPLKGGKRTKKSGHEWPMVRIESTDPRELAGVKVCRLKWYLVEEGKKPIGFDDRGINEHLLQDSERQPRWYEAQDALKNARQVAISRKGLLVLQRQNDDKTSEAKLAEKIGKKLSTDLVSFPGRGASAQQQADLEKTGHAFRRWSFSAGEHQIWCYGHKDDKCDADDTVCHEAACFVHNLGLVALYFDTGTVDFPKDFIFYSLVGFPEFASWRPLAGSQSK